MQEIETKSCTDVIFDVADITLDNLALTNKTLDFDWKSTQQQFRANINMQINAVKDIAEQALFMETPVIARVPAGRQKINREDQVNEIRSRIRSALLHSTAQSANQIARIVGCHRQTVVAVQKQLAIRGYIQEYRFRPGHTEETLMRLDTHIRDQNNKFWSVSNYKQQVPECSKRFIAKTLKQHGLRYLKAKRERKLAKRPEFNKKDLQVVLKTSIQAYTNDDVVLLFMDEAEFPLANSSDY